MRTGRGGTRLHRMRVYSPKGSILVFEAAGSEDNLPQSATGLGQALGLELGLKVLFLRLLGLLLGSSE